ncbi:hypothetical protein MSG28_002205 [Choristoneura fumiferana]|uniref:Uncharacterized protein n=1 Tax=Choristoneura fumiferana TaxID=7141 RepID=A0ACC0JUT7_CHOFU|nr:hypothetical protein MSG28_002205 [Choristoneura fumiferana]
MARPGPDAKEIRRSMTRTSLRGQGRREHITDPFYQYNCKIENVATVSLCKGNGPGPADTLRPAARRHLTLRRRHTEL